MRARHIKTGFHHIVIAIALLATLPACQSGAQPPMPMNRASALVNGTIKIGMDRQTVIDWLGLPRIEKYGTTEFFFYNVPWQMAVGTIGRIPIAITDGKVVGFGKSYYDNVLKSVNKS